MREYEKRRYKNAREGNGRVDVGGREEEGRIRVLERTRIVYMR